MPELPEVETIRRDLAGLLEDRRVEGVEIRDVRVLTGFKPSGAPRRRVSPSAFRERLRGRVIRAVGRRGKYLIFRLDDGAALLAHLRMTGQLIVGPARPDARAVIRFEGGADALNFCDARRFGELWIAEDPGEDPSVSALGPEPLADGLDEAAWGRALRSSRSKLQSALLDQKRLAGLGNIYVTEALFLTGLRPTRRCRAVRVDDVPVLLRNIRSVLEAGLRHRGVSFYSYRDAQGRKGEAQKHLWVYGRAGEPCRRCGTTVVGVKVGGRGTAYCPRCQK